MIFNFKPNKIVVDCFTPFKSVYDLYKIRKAISYFPEDIKSMDRYATVTNQQTNITQKVSTIKGCNGLVDIYKMGFIIPFWTDAVFQPKSHSEGKSALGLMPRDFNFDTHPPIQYQNLFDGWLHAKLHSPWKIKEKTGVQFSWNGALWNTHKHAKNFLVVPGGLWFDTQTTSHVNVFINRDVERFELNGGTPLVHVIPLSDKEVEVKCHFVSVEEYLKVDPIPEEFNGMSLNRWGKYYRDLKKSKDLDKAEAKCPFGFGRK
jgi:hypothetical protein